jgi:hypothetical protein
MTYRDACAFLGLDPGEPPAGPRVPRPPPVRDPLAHPREVTPPPDLWSEKAAALVTWAEGQLWGDTGAAARAYLAGRGLSPDTIRAARLGWNPERMFRPRASWGMENKTGEDGKPVTRFNIPAGLVIPCHDPAGRVVRVTVRTGAEPPYWVITGSDRARCLVVGATAPAVVVESELDALLLAQESGDLVAAVALLTVAGKPDTETAARLRAAPVVLVSLDSDTAGARASWESWKDTTNARRWPIPYAYGKDPTDAHRAGLDLRAWVEAGLEDAGLSPALAENSEGTASPPGAPDPMAAAPATGPHDPPGPSPAFLAWLAPVGRWARLDVAMPRTLLKLGTWPPHLDDGDKARLLTWIPAAVEALGMLAQENPDRARHLARNLATIEAHARAEGALTP